MDWVTLALGLVGMFILLMIGRFWRRMHESHARQMLDYGDRERNKWGMWR